MLSMYVRLNEYPLISHIRFSASDSIGLPFLSKTKLFVFQVFLASMNDTVYPVNGDAGKVPVTDAVVVFTAQLDGFVMIKFWVVKV